MEQPTQAEALRLADCCDQQALAWIDGTAPHQERRQTAAELRRLHTENESLRASQQAERAAPEYPPMPSTWCVSAFVNGETMLSIGHNWVTGKGELSEAETNAVIGMAQHLLAFVGYGLPPSSFDPDNATPVQQAEPAGDAASTLSVDDAELLQKAVTDFEEFGETDVPDADLRRFAAMGLLECAHYQVMPAAQDAIDAAIASQQS